MSNKEIKDIVDFLMGEDPQTRFCSITVKRSLKDKMDETIGKMGKKMNYSQFIKYAIELIEKENKK